MTNSQKNFAFPRESRLLKGSEYTGAMKQSDSIVKSKGIICFVKKNSEGHSRLGLAIPKKKVRRAVDRNRIKRLFREAFRQKKRDFCFFDVVMMPSGATVNMENIEIFSSLNHIFTQLEILTLSD